MERKVPTDFAIQTRGICGMRQRLGMMLLPWRTTWSMTMRTERLPIELPRSMGSKCTLGETHRTVVGGAPRFPGSMYMFLRK